MERVIVEVRRQDEARGHDLELAPDLPSEQLIPLVVEAMGWADLPGAPAAYSIESTPPGRTLRPDESLAQAQAWDGATLVFVPRRAQAESVRPQGFAWTRLG